MVLGFFSDIFFSRFFELARLAPALALVEVGPGAQVVELIFSYFVRVVEALKVLFAVVENPPTVVLLSTFSKSLPLLYLKDVWCLSI